MRRDEALANIGKRVYVLTFNGDYIGKLLSITDVRPFRAKVEVQEVVEWPGQFDMMGNPTHRSPYREGYILPSIGAVELDTHHPGGGDESTWGALDRPRSYAQSAITALEYAITIYDHPAAGQRLQSTVPWLREDLASWEDRCPSCERRQV